MINKIRSYFQLCFRVIHHRWPLLLSLSVSVYLIEYTLYLLTQQTLLLSPEGSIGLTLSLIIQSLLYLLLGQAYVVVILSTCQAFHQKTEVPSWEKILSEHFNQLIIENLRFLAKVLFRLPLVIPAFTAWVYFGLYQPIVILDSKYKQGHRDVFKYSQNLVLKNFWKTALVLLVISLGPSLAEALLYGASIETKNPLLTSLSIPILSIVHTFANVLLFKYFLNIQKTSLCALITQ